MALRPEQLEARIERLERVSRTSPRGYRMRVALLAAVGYGYVIGVPTVCLALLTCCIWWLLAGMLYASIYTIPAVLGISALVIVKALRVEFSSPDGIQLSRSSAPELFNMVDELAARLKAPVPERVYVTHGFNAAVVQWPRYGLFGGHINTLILGLPYLMASPPEYVRGTIAHELGHLSGNHGRFAGRIYLMRRVWSQLLEGIEKHRNVTSVIFTGFLRWYAPLFNAYSFVLARANEYDADQCEVEVIGARTCAASLIQVTLNGRYLHTKLWPDIYRQVFVLPEPPEGVFLTLAQALRAGPSHDEAERLWVQALKLKTDYDDTHPALCDRLAAIGYVASSGVRGQAPERLSMSGRPETMVVTRTQEGAIEELPLPGSVSTTAADVYLGQTAKTLADDLSRQWRQTMAGGWLERHLIALAEQSDLRMLKRKALTEGLDRDEAILHARFTAQYRPQTLL